MVERIAEAVRNDGVPVNAILALTFTEKAAGELAERLRRRLTELGDDEHARAVDGAWIGTIHGFCARLLRSQPLAAGLDPRFEVLEETAAERLADAAYDDALEAWARAPTPPPRSTSPPPTAPACGTSSSAPTRRCAPAATPAPVQVPPPHRRARPGGAGRGAARRRCATSRVGRRRRARAAARSRAAGVRAAHPARSGSRGRATLNAADSRAARRRSRPTPCEAYRAAWAAYRAACAEHHAHCALDLIDGLLTASGALRAGQGRARAAVDFEDLELRARDLLDDAPTRERWAERFPLLMIDEFQDTNAVQLGILEYLERDNLFAVGDEFQSIYRFRHADVGIFRNARRADAARATPERELPLAARSCWTCSTRRSRPCSGSGSRRCGRAARSRRWTTTARCGCSAWTRRGEPPVELHITDTTGWDEIEPRLASHGGGDQPWRRAEARHLAHRLRAEVESGRRAGDIVVLVRATAVPAAVRGGAGGAGPADLRRRRPRLLVAGAGPRRARVAARAREPARRGSAADRAVLAVPRRRHRRARPARGRGGRTRGSLWAALQARRLPIGRLLAAEREHAERAPLEVLLERAIVATGYDLAMLARPGGTAGSRTCASSCASRRVRTRRGPRPPRLPRRRAGP